MSDPAFAPIAVIGFGCVFPPDSYDATSYWQNILAGRSGIAPRPRGGGTGAGTTLRTGSRRTRRTAGWAASSPTTGSRPRRTA